MTKDHSTIGGIILAAGKGKRMQMDDKNKVVMLLHNEPIVLRIVRKLESLHLGKIVVVIGYEKQSVIDVLRGKDVAFVEQAEQLGTAHAVQVGLEKLDETISDTIVVYGDDASFYPNTILDALVAQHLKIGAAVSIVTFTVSNPDGLGRIVRDEEGRLKGIVEEKNATNEQLTITEINSGLYLFNIQFLRSYLDKIEKDPISQEYYLTDIIELALVNNEKVGVVEAGDIPWFGINTKEELAKAEQVNKMEII